MPITATTTSASAALDALRAAVADAKGSDPLAPVAVVVPTNQCGVMARRSLGRAGGVVGVDMVTLNRLAELLAGPTLAESGRRPLSTPVLDVTIRAVLDEQPGRYERVAHHPSTVVALRELHHELRLLGSAGADSLAASWRGAEPARVSSAVTARLAAGWYDEADLLTVATGLAERELPGALRQLVVHLPQRLTPLQQAFVRALATTAHVRVIAADTTTAAERASIDTLHETAAVGAGQATTSMPSPSMPSPAAVISAADADEEVRQAVTTLLDAARGVDGDPVPFERMAVLWPTSRPYARLLEHHLTAVGIPWNGPTGTHLTERLTPRLLLDLLDIDRSGLRRRDLFDFLADVPARDTDGHPLRTTEWTRASRVAGVSRGSDWIPRLDRLAQRDRWAEPAQQLAGFVTELRATLGPRRATRSWWDWAEWCDQQLDRWLGRAMFRSLPEPEYRAWESLSAVLERLRHLDRVAPHPSRAEFRAVLAAELDETGARQGRVGSGVSIGPLAGAIGIDIDVAVVLGAADGLLPPAPLHDPLISDVDRSVVGLDDSEERSRRLAARYRDVLTIAHTTVTVPRGDLRATTRRHPSRWLHDLPPEVPVSTRASHAGGLAATTFPASSSEWRLRHRLRATRGGLPLASLLDPTGDVVERRALDLRRARMRPEITEYDGDLTALQLPPLRDAVSATQLQAWSKCPHAYFARYVLGVFHDEEPDAEIAITPLEKGSLQHEALDRFHRDVIDGRLPPPEPGGWTDVHRAALDKHARDVCDEWERRGRAGRPATWRGERGRILAEIATWFERDTAVTAGRVATPLASEWRFGPDDGVTLPIGDNRTLLLKGAIDRVDRCANGDLIVSDHKTGSTDSFKNLDADDPTMGRTLFQLPAYAAAAARLVERRGDPTPPIIRAEYSMMRRGDFARIGIEFTDDVWRTVQHDLALVVRGIENGVYPPTPVRPGWRMRVDCPYCEPDGLGTAGAWRVWERKRDDPRLAEWFGPHEVTDE